mgnify:FL=1
MRAVSIHQLAGQKVRPADYPDLEMIKKAYEKIVPDPDSEEQRVSFGTSGHRGKAADGSFTDAHVAAIVQAICTLRERFGATGPVFVGADTHYLSQLAYQTVLQVLAANGLTVCIDSERDFVPTPALSRAVIRYNEGRADKLADGILITPSHNPPDCGGIKYNPVTGGPAGRVITKAVEAEANRLLAAGNKDVRRYACGDERIDAACERYDYKALYVDELDEVIDMRAVSTGRLTVLVNALGGAGMNYWHKIAEKYDISLDFINDSYDPQFTFMTYDHDGRVRMDCSSPYVMAGVMKSGCAYDLILANDPDYDRFGIVCGPDGMLLPNAFLTVAAHYLATHRDFSGKGIGKTVVTTELLHKIAVKLNVPCYEVPVGFKYFVELLSGGDVFFAGEESAGATCIKKDGALWTTDKDGIVMCLLACEITAVTGKSLPAYYADLCRDIGPAFTSRSDTPATKEEKSRIAAVRGADIKNVSLCGKPVTSKCTETSYGKLAIGGIKVATDDGWIAARPSGTEDLYKLYGESYISAAHAERLLAAGRELIDKAIKNAE